MADRTCSICGNTYPLDKQHFRWRVKDGKGFFTSECRVCRKASKRRDKEKKREQRDEALRRIEEAGADVFLASVATGGSNIPHSAEVLERVMEYFGGVGGFSAMLVKQYYDAPPGSSARNRLLETLCRLVSKNVEQGGAKKPLTLWSEEELEQELNKRFEQAVSTYKGTTINVKAEDPKLLAVQAAEEASNLAAAGHPIFALPDPVSAGQPEGTPKRTKGKKARGPAAVPPEPESGGDPRLPGE